ncbi:MBL fold metallo-hydrolase [Paraconexibacter antarcticus]|uniref:MBL fold metallo-hydrolase n=2 Tax=Paraconexibacter antarcticus TaxID=2949664 RepID=A0ABY5E0E5_9ACTN|nr:MBL fold metallo-hydrolase [Paraconexibacter antarcticus]UTI67093.1 MBL fold metallo-hydrolase [Paraconexibacter antarcticus]
MPSPDHVHVHVLDTSDGPLLIDTGAVGCEAALAAGLEAIGVRPTRVLITHAHIDHWGLATTFGDTVLAHPGVLPSLRFASDGATPVLAEAWPGAEKMAAVFSAFTTMASGVPKVDELHDGQLLGDWQVHWTPGHDPGHVCLFRPTDGVLICGDLLLPGYTPNIQPGFDGADALADFLHSLQRMAALPVSLVLPAHGERYVDAQTRAGELAAHHARRLQELQAALRRRPRPPRAQQPRVRRPPAGARRSDARPNGDLRPPRSPAPPRVGPGPRRRQLDANRSTCDPIVTGYATRMPADTRREQLLDATRRVVARGGYTALTMEAIAREAGVTKPVVYSAFANRDDVMARLLEVEGARVVADIGAVIERAAHETSTADLTAMVSLGLGLVLDVVRRQHQRYRLILVGIDGAPLEVRQAVDEGRRTVTARIAAILGRAPLPAGTDAALLATILVGIGEHAATLVLTEPDVTPERLAQSVQDLLRLPATATPSHEVWT